MQKVNGHVKINGISTFIDKVGYKLNQLEIEITKLQEEYNKEFLDTYQNSFFFKNRALEKCKAISRFNYDESYFEYLNKIVPMQDKLVRLEKLLLIAVSASMHENELYVSFEDYYYVVE